VTKVDVAPARRCAPRVASSGDGKPAVAAHRCEGVPGRREEQVTVSIGVADLPGGAGSPEELLAGADRALYLAEYEGKDRVCVLRV